MRQRITPEELLAEFEKDNVNCGHEQGWRCRADYVDDTFSAVHATLNRILDEKMSTIEFLMGRMN